MVRMRDSILSACRSRPEWPGRAWPPHDRCRNGESLWALPHRLVPRIRSGGQESAGAVSGWGGKSRKVPGFPVLAGVAWRCGGTRGIRVLRRSDICRVERGSSGYASGVGMRPFNPRGAQSLERGPRVGGIASLHRSRDREGCDWDRVLKHPGRFSTCCLDDPPRTYGKRLP